MKKYADEMRSLFPFAGIYMTVYLVCALFLSIGNGRNGKLCCMSDIVLDSAYKNMFLLAPFVVLVMIKYFNGDFRVSVILRYEGAGGFVNYIWKKILIFALVLSVLQLAGVCVSGAPAGISTNWGSPDSYICLMYGVIMKNPVPVTWVIISVWAGMFMELMLLQAVLCVLWLISETPLLGLVVTVCLVVIESASRNGVEILFSRVGIEIGNYVTGVVNVIGIIIYTVIAAVILYIFMQYSIIRKDYLKVI